jgi:hypothetical protein
MISLGRNFEILNRNVYQAHKPDDQNHILMVANLNSNILKISFLMILNR